LAKQLTIVVALAQVNAHALAARLAHATSG
jgi:hypothetical protein